MTTIQAVVYANPDKCPPIVNGARLLAASGYRVRILARDTGEIPEVRYPSEVEVHRVGGSAHNSMQMFVRFIVDVMRYADSRATIIWGHDMHGFVPATLLARRYRRPLVYQSHELVIEPERLARGGRLVFQFQRRFARTAQLMIVPDEERGSILRKVLALRTTPLVAANAPLRQATGTGELLHAMLLAQNRSFDAIVFRQGSIGPGHAIESTIRSIPMWNNPNAGFVLMGPIYPEFVAEMRRLAEEHGVANRLAVLPPVSYDEIFAYTGGANIGHALYSPVDANNRFSTTASNKLMEYMAARLPVLVSDRPGLRALVQTHDCGVTADESSPESIAAAINSLLNDPGQAQHMGQAGRHAFEEIFCYENQFAPVLAAVNQLAATA